MTLDEQQTTYRDQAIALTVAVEEYEQAHPTGAPCFYDVLERMKAVVDATPGGAA